jgi:hypothetical protein
VNRPVDQGCLDHAGVNRRLLLHGGRVGEIRKEVGAVLEELAPKAFVQEADEPQYKVKPVPDFFAEAKALLSEAAVL